MYDFLKRRFEADLIQQIDNGDISEEEADEMMVDWENGYGDYLYDCMRDRQLEEAWARGDSN